MNSFKRNLFLETVKYLHTLHKYCKDLTGFARMAQYLQKRCQQVHWYSLEIYTNLDTSYYLHVKFSFRRGHSREKSIQKKNVYEGHTGHITLLTRFEICRILEVKCTLRHHTYTYTFSLYIFILWRCRYCLSACFYH